MYKLKILYSGEQADSSGNGWGRGRAKKKKRGSPGWCGSVDGVLECEAKGHWFDSQSGHMPGLWAGSPVGGA